MPFTDPSPDPSAAAQFVALAGQKLWRRRLGEISERCREASLSGRAAQARHAIELVLARLLDAPETVRPGIGERRIAAFAREAVALSRRLPAPARARLRERIEQGLTGHGTLVPVFHLIRTAALQRARGYEVSFDGLTEGTAHDLLIRRDGVAAEIACETVSAEEGRALHRGDWVALVDQVNPELQTWLAAHPGRYILKMTVAEDLGPGAIAALQARITDMLSSQKRQEQSPEVMLKLDPLVLAGVQAVDRALPARLREQFGPEAHLAVTTCRSGGSVFVMAARSGRENAIAEAVTRRMSAATPARLSGERPGMLAMFVEDIERAEWRHIREKLELEGATRRFLTGPEARRLVAVTCTSRLELFGAPPPDGAPQGEIRFRNQAHPAAKHAGLMPAIASSV